MEELRDFLQKGADRNEIKVKRKHKIRKIIHYLGFILFIILASLCLIYFYYDLTIWKYFKSEPEEFSAIFNGVLGPFIGVLGIIVVYISFRQQLIANQMFQRQEKERQLIWMLEEVQKSIEELEYDRKRGVDAISMFKFKLPTNCDIQSYFHSNEDYFSQMESLLDDIFRIGRYLTEDKLLEESESFFWNRLNKISKRFMSRLLLITKKLEELYLNEGFLPPPICIMIKDIEDGLKNKDMRP